MRRTARSQLVPNCDLGSKSPTRRVNSDNRPVGDPLAYRFIEAMGRRGVPKAGSVAVLSQILEAARLTRERRRSDEWAQARVAMALIAAEDKAAELSAMARSAS